MLYLLAASLLWAFSFGLIKGQLAGFDPVLVACGRLFLAALAFAPLMVRARLPHSLGVRAMALGVVQFGLMYVLYITSFIWLPAWQVALFTIFTPLYVVAMADVAERRLVPRHLFGAVVAVVGAALVLRHDFGSADWRGVLLLQGANLCFAWGQLRFGRLRRDARGHDAALIGWMYLGAFVATLLVVLVRTPGGITAVAGWPSSALWSLLYLGLLPTGVGFYLWNRGAARTAVGLLAVANNLKVPLAVLVSWTVFGEVAPFLRVGLGLGLILVGLVVVGPRRAGI